MQLAAKENAGTRVPAFPLNRCRRLQVRGSGTCRCAGRPAHRTKALAFVEIAHAGAFDSRDVNEHIRPAAVLHDEAEALLGVEELDSTCGHNGLLGKTQNSASMPHANHSRGPHIRILRVLGKRPVGTETSSTAKSRTRLYTVVLLFLQSRRRKPCAAALVAIRTRGLDGCIAHRHLVIFSSQLWRKNGGASPTAVALGASRRILKSFCIVLRHKDDTPHESRACVACRLVTTVQRSMRVCLINNKKKRERQGNRRASQEEMFPWPTPRSELRRAIWLFPKRPLDLAAPLRRLNLRRRPVNSARSHARPGACARPHRGEQPAKNEPGRDVLRPALGKARSRVAIPNEV